VKVADPMAVVELTKALDRYWMDLNQHPELE